MWLPLLLFSSCFNQLTLKLARMGWTAGVIDAHWVDKFRKEFIQHEVFLALSFCLGYLNKIENRMSRLNYL